MCVRAVAVYVPVWIAGLVTDHAQWRFYQAAPEITVGAPSPVGVVTPQGLPDLYAA